MVEAVVWMAMVASETQFVDHVGAEWSMTYICCSHIQTKAAELKGS